MASDKITFFVPCRGKRLDVHFGLGREAFVCGLGSQDTSVCTSLIWNVPSRSERQCGYQTFSHLQRLQNNISNGGNPVSSVKSAAKNISDCLQVISPLDEEDGTKTLLQTDSAIWDLIVLLFVRQGGRNGYVAEALSKWTHKHANILGSGLDADCTKYYDEILAILRSERGTPLSADNEGIYWKLLQQVIAQGWMSSAQELISEHWLVVERDVHQGTREEEKTLELLTALDVLLSRVPSYEDSIPQQWSSFDEFLNYQTQWVQTISETVSEVTDSSQDENGLTMSEKIGSVKEMDAVFKILTANQRGSEGSQQPASWLYMLVDILLHVHPNTKVTSELTEIVRYCKRSCHPCTIKLHDLIDQIITAAVDRNASTALGACTRSNLASPWLLAHISTLLATHPSFSPQIQGVDDGAMMQTDPPSNSRILVHCNYDLAEYLMLTYVNTLLAHPGTWKLALSHLSSCSAGGEAAATIVVDCWPSAAEGDGVVAGRLSDYAKRLGLISTAGIVARTHSMADWHQGRLERALRTSMQTSDSAAWASLFLRPLEKHMLDHLMSPALLSQPPPVLISLSGLLSSALSDVAATQKCRHTMSETFGPQLNSDDTACCIAVYGALCRACQQFATLDTQAADPTILTTCTDEIRRHVHNLLDGLLPAHQRPHLLRKLQAYLGVNSLLFTHQELMQVLVSLEKSRTGASLPKPTNTNALVESCSLSATELQSLDAILLTSIASSAATGV